MDEFLHARLAAQHGPKLLALGREVFGDDLNDAEIALFMGLGVLDGRQLIAPINDVMSLPELRADRVAWLLVEPEARELLTPQGIQIQFATIKGNLDISFCQADLPLVLAHCHLDEGLTLHNAKLAILALLGSRCGSIVAERIIIKGSVILRNKLTTKGEIRLNGAEIGGDFECDGATLYNPGGNTLHADGIKVMGSVFLRGTTTKGEVRFLGAEVGHNFECRGATFENPQGYSLNADGIKVKGAVFLLNTTTRGEVRFLGAEVDGDVSCIGTALYNPENKAFNADGIRVKGAVFLNNTTAKGEVRLITADIGGNLDCDGATLNNPDGVALSADGIKVRGAVFLRDKFTAKGVVRLPGAEVGIDIDCTGGAFENLKGKALSADGIKVKRHLLLWKNFKAHGLLDFTNATIEGWLVHITVEEPDKAELYLTGAHVGALWDEKKSWPSPGKLHLDNFHYDRIHKKAPWDVKDRLEWLDRQPKGEFSTQPYEQLAKVYREAGREEDERKVLYAKNKHRAECVRDKVIPSHLIEKIWLFLTWLLVGYGYRPWRGLAAFGLLVLFGFSLFALINGTGHTTPTALNLNPQGEVLSPFNPLYYSLDAAIPLVELGQTAAWTMSGWLAQGYNAFHTVAGWVIVLLLVGALTGLIKK